MRPPITQGSIIHTAALHAPNLDFYTEAKIQQGADSMTDWGYIRKLDSPEAKSIVWVFGDIIGFPIWDPNGCPWNFGQQLCASRQISDASIWRELAMC